MNDPLTPIEARLRGVKMRPLPSTMPDRISDALTASCRPAQRDWPLWGAIVSGAVAACIIVATLLAWPSALEPGRPSLAHVLQSQHPTGEQALASASPRWGDELSQLQDRRFP